MSAVGGMPLLSGPVAPRTGGRAESSCRKCNRDFNFILNRGRRCNHCGYSYCHSCSDFQALMPRSGAESGYDPVHVCAFCMQYLSITAGGKGYLRSQSLAKLKNYVQAYNIRLGPGLLEKDDVINAIMAARTRTGTLPSANEDFYRRNAVPDGRSTRTRGLFSRNDRERNAPRQNLDPSQPWTQPNDFARPDLENEQASPPNQVPHNRQNAPPQSQPRFHPQSQPRPQRPTQPQRPPSQSFTSSAYRSYPSPRAPYMPNNRPFATAFPLRSASATSSNTRNMTGASQSYSPRSYATSTSTANTQSSSMPRAATRPSAPSTPTPTLDQLLAMSPEEISRLSIHNLKAVLFENHVSSGPVLEKSDLVARVRVLIDMEKRERERRREVLEAERLAQVRAEEEAQIEREAERERQRVLERQWEIDQMNEQMDEQVEWEAERQRQRELEREWEADQVNEQVEREAEREREREREREWEADQVNEQIEREAERELETERIEAQMARDAERTIQTQTESRVRGKDELMDEIYKLYRREMEEDKGVIQAISVERVKEMRLVGMKLKWNQILQRARGALEDRITTMIQSEISQLTMQIEQSKREQLRQAGQSESNNDGLYNPTVGASESIGQGRAIPERTTMAARLYRVTVESGSEGDEETDAVELNGSSNTTHDHETEMDVGVETEPINSQTLPSQSTAGVTANTDTNTNPSITTQTGDSLLSDNHPGQNSHQSTTDITSTSNNQSNNPQKPVPTTSIRPPKPVLPERNGLCIVCQDEEANIVIVDCGHLALCRGCADLIWSSTRECPLCRTRIVTEARFLRVFKT